MDRDKVIKGVECHRKKIQTTNAVSCLECTYSEPNPIREWCMSGLMDDIYAMLKEQEEEIKRLKGELHGFGDLFHTLSEKAKVAMAEQPKVVRCKDCKNIKKLPIDNHGHQPYWCENLNIYSEGLDWFCADGVRREVK